MHIEVIEINIILVVLKAGRSVDPSDKKFTKRVLLGCVYL